MEHPDTYPFPDTITAETTESASCRSVDPELFFPEPGRQTAAQARAICADCPLKAACLQAALDADLNPAGVWGGTTERERRDIRSGRKPPKRPAGLICTVDDCAEPNHGRGFCSRHYAEHRRAMLRGAS